MVVTLAAVASVLPPALSGQSGALVFTNVTVIDGTGAAAQPAMTVVIRNDRIEAIGQDILDGRKRVLRVFIGLVGLMRRNGVQVMTGTDLSDGRIFPGFSVHEELALLVEAGFTPSEAIQAATRVPAEFLRLTDAGTVQQGKRADLVLLSANPLDDIHNTTKIDAIVLRGQLLDRARLDGLLRDAERLAAIN